MEKHYKLQKIDELADGDQEFISTIAQAFTEEVPADLLKLKKAVKESDLHAAYQLAHKLKPTLALFELKVSSTLLEIEKWGKKELELVNVEEKLEQVVLGIELTIAEIKADFKF